MEKTELGTRGGGRNALTVSHQAWTAAGKPDQWQFDHRTKQGRRLTPAERYKAARAGRRAELRLARDPKHLRARLERLKAELND